MSIVRELNIQTNRHTDIQKEIYPQINRQAKTYRQRDKQTDRIVGHF